jgi:homoserine kinase
MCLNTPGDILEISTAEGPAHRIINDSGIKLPDDPAINVSAVAIDAMLRHLSSDRKFTIRFIRKIPPGSGIGSSAASSAGAVYGANMLLGHPFSGKELIPFAMKGEEAASGSAHADNVAPLLLGGFTLIRSYQPLDIISIRSPDNLFCAVVHPDISLATQDSRRILKDKVPLKTALEQCGNLAGLVTGLLTSDFRLIGASLHDAIAEPERAFLIPGYKQIREAAVRAGALGASISGSGPSVFALASDRQTADKAGEEMRKAVNSLRIKCSVFVSTVNNEGITLLGDH